MNDNLNNFRSGVSNIKFLQTVIKVQMNLKELIIIFKKGERERQSARARERERERARESESESDRERGRERASKR